MKKQRLTSLIEKYSLSGTIETVTWKTNNKETIIEFTHPDKTLIGKTILKNSDLLDSELGIFDTNKLVQMLSVLNEDINFDILVVNNNPVNIDLKDTNYNLKFVLADASIVPQPAKLKALPEFEITFDVDTDFNSKFLNALKAVPAASVSFKPNNNSIDVIIGYSDTTNTNSIKFSFPATCSTDKTTTFSTEHLKNILTANRGLSGKIGISSHGLMKLDFTDNDFNSEYFLVQASLN